MSTTRAEAGLIRPHLHTAAFKIAYVLTSCPHGVKLSRGSCKIACVARPGQQVVAGDRLADRIGIGVLTKV
ncbi:MAG: hypothetical protein ACM3ML_32805, partial [Micromonosporaceae bacterium]